MYAKFLWMIVTVAFFFAFSYHSVLASGALIKAQWKFSRMVGSLLLRASALEYKVTIGDVQAIAGHRKGSLHALKLAIDLNLYNEKGEYLSRTEDHAPLGEYWESIGGSWGGRFGDGNHYSLEWEGRK